jgi:hypothetical protein
LHFTLTIEFAIFKFTENTRVTIAEHKKSEGNAHWTSYTYNSVLPRSISDIETINVNCEKLQTCTHGTSLVVLQMYSYENMAKHFIFTASPNTHTH